MPQLKVSKEALAELTERIQKVYLDDKIPWVVGYSGGKDSTATLELLWYAIRELPEEQRKHKTVHVISTDTLVESPVVAQWVNESLRLMRDAAKDQDMPIEVHRLTPEPKHSYWTNLIGRGYPAPRQGFRWCTNRLKIQPSNQFIMDVVKNYGEAIMVLGTRKAESATRSANMTHHEKHRMRQWLSPNASLPNSLVFTPIEDWSNDDVWMYLMQKPNPWDRSNKDLLTMYRGASADNECPLVVDTTTPSCGNSRFGCWVCTLVAADKSMEAMIHNDDEKRWMKPLLDLRNEIANAGPDGKINDFDRRDFRRMDKSVKFFKDAERANRPIHGPYTKKWREHWLRKLLQIERLLQEHGPKDDTQLQLITLGEIREIRRIWVEDKHEFDDAVPRIYLEVTGKEYPYLDDLPRRPFGPAEWDMLKEICGNDNNLLLELQTSMLDIEQQNRGLILRRGIVDELEKTIHGCYYSSVEDAVSFHQRLKQLKAEAEQLHLPFDEEEGMDSDDLPSD
ncbi:MAG TPA: DNA phosphorothioation system sulfurtransferase DndC [Symbiobacteriaceae bacterium]|jgi:DNA sulfur modification protein DndC